MSEFLSVYITTATRDEAEKIALAIVEENLAPCANIFPGVRSIYRWQGKIEQADECVLIAKTTADKYAALETRIKQLHSYDCPCIVAMPIVAGNKDYLEWLQKN